MENLKQATIRSWGLWLSSFPAGHSDSTPSLQPGQAFVESFRENLCELAGDDFQFSEPLAEGSEWDIYVGSDEQAPLRIEIAFLPGECGHPAPEWVITIFPETDLFASEPPATETVSNSSDLLCNIIRRIFQQRTDVTVVQGVVKSSRFDA